jgi:hypothetical protein
MPRATSSNGSRWQIFAGDLDLTLDWKPETDLIVVPSDDEISSHVLVGGGAKCMSSTPARTGQWERSNPP